MNYFFIRFVYPWVPPVLIAIIVLAMVLRKKLCKPIIYRYSLGQTLKNNRVVSSHPHKKIMYCLRVLALILLAIVIGKPQYVDSRSKVPVSGIDIVVVLDASGSMQFQDYDDDNRSRFEVAKAEAIHFIEKREQDAIGLVLFGKDTLSRCPITFDKQLLVDVVDELKLGDIDPDGTMLITGMVTAANRLKHSKSKSKVMILLTDGEPSDGDMDPSVGIDVAKKLGIKVYTVGIGSEENQVYTHPVYGLFAKPKVNKDLLTHIARVTDGQFFMARNARGMRTIYDTIDQLEKTEHEVPIFSLYYDIFVPFIGAIVSICAVELLLSTFVWFAL